MKVLAVFLLLLMGATASAMWAYFSDADLIAKSDLIVFGEITEARQITQSDGQASLNAAVVHITELLKGGGNPTEALLSMPSAESSRSSADIFYRVGQKGLWFLRVRPQIIGKDSVYLADHPQRFIPADQTEKIKVFRSLLRSAPQLPK